jgi:hypothetical protein
MTGHGNNNYKGYYTPIRDPALYARNDGAAITMTDTATITITVTIIIIRTNDAKKLKGTT